MKNIIRFILSVALPLAVGGIAGFFTSSSVQGWFATLEKPSFNPPSWLFGPVWTVLYIMMGIAFYLVWVRATPGKTKQTAMLFYFVQLFFNFCWSFIFFYAEQPGWALVDIVLLWVLIVSTIYWFSKAYKPAAWLLVPYILWVSFATALNFAIWQLN